MDMIIQASYLIAAVLFILGLKQMSSPVTARRGILWAGAGMVLATLVTFMTPEVIDSAQASTNIMLIIVAIAIGGGYAWYSGRKVAMTDMPQMIAMYNGMGGGAAAAIAAVELLKASSEAAVDPSGATTIASVLGTDVAILAILGAVIGTISFSGSIIAWAKLDGRLSLSRILPKQHLVNAVLAIATVGFAIAIYFSADINTIIIFFVLALILGVFITVPVGGADMPVIISLFNALTGLAVGFEGYVLGNAAMIIAGIVVGSAGSLLTQLMAKAMNRSVANVFFAGVGTDAAAPAGDGIEGVMKEIQAQDAGILMAFASQVIIIPGYGMAVAQAQHAVKEMTEVMQAKGVEVKFAIHPVAGRMPGHMNVLLAEADVPYDIVFEMDEINNEFTTADVALIIGANDVVNPDAKTLKSSPLYGMPIIEAYKARLVFICKRSMKPGYAGVENSLFFADNASLVFGDAKATCEKLAAALHDA
ncbi:MAG: NAD(P)(+) transhydrogenase (Re/Si-specific) subunit beta [Proteobacteria bacterium]|nr:NAD(P)(+) transhydrogenase (Re/Si-specific) subunit beta [Pseudomonadota bacterium]